MNKLIDANNPKSKEEKQIVAVIESSIDKFLLEESKATLKEIVDKQIFIDATPNNTTINPYEAIETVLNYIDNSISKEVIKEKIEKYKQQLKNKTKRVVQLQVLEQNGGLQQSQWEELSILFGDIEKIRGKLEVLQELLEGK